MKSKILTEVKRIISEIKATGIVINGTLELNNIISEFYPHRLEMDKEKDEIMLFYNNFVGSWVDRLELERDHYHFLESFIIHKIKENQYFFKLDPKDFSSRKNVIHSNDCILGMQFLSRPNRNILNIFIRSSDTVNLLKNDDNSSMADKFLTVKKKLVIPHKKHLTKAKYLTVDLIIVRDKKVRYC